MANQYIKILQQVKRNKWYGDHFQSPAQSVKYGWHFLHYAHEGAEALLDQILSLRCQFVEQRHTQIVSIAKIQKIGHISEDRPFFEPGEQARDGKGQPAHQLR